MSAIAAKGGVANDPILVSSAFDSGNIVFDGIEESTGTILCRIGPEPFTEGTDKKQHLQWFHFRVSNVAAKTVSVSISNAGQSSYPSGWPNYKVCASYDKESWFRCQNTKYDAACGHLNWSINIPEGQGTIWFAYFAPYSYERHQALVGRCSSSPFAQLRVIGSTLDGRDIDMLVVGNGPKKFFITARQHPGESMAEWCCEGFLDRLLDENDAMAKMLRSKATFFVVPNANPDGSVRGHLRTNACGANLNREWAPTGDYTAPSLERSPEIYHIMRVLDEQGCDGFLDIHGDEEIEANFLNGGFACPNWNEALERQYNMFSSKLLQVNPDFQTVKGYPPKPKGQANLSICSAQITHRYQCFAATLEQPFKDCADEFPQPYTGWNPERSRHLGGTLLDAFAVLL